MLKSRNCGDLRVDDVGREVTLSGWVHRRRDHGALIFIDLRDRSGIVQVTCNADRAPDAHAVLADCRNEYVIQVRGVVASRPEGLRNSNLATGDIEVSVTEAHILNEARTTPFYINEDADVDEALRLKYRYLDLRRLPMQQNMILRHQVVKLIRDFLDRRGFLEIETPVLIKTTPEGARDYVVPSRVHPGEFYALPQSPQQLKQLLMVAGYERYFQIARCFRDEDLRADRQPEFTQLDLEMSFVDREDIMATIEPLYAEIIETLGQKPILAKPFPVLTYREAMDRFGTDKPDLRFGMEIVELSDITAETEFVVFSDAVAQGGAVRAIVAPGAAGFSRKQLDDLGELAKRYGARGVVTIALMDDGSVKSSAAKYLTDLDIAAIAARVGAQPGHLILIVADPQRETTARALGELRLALGRQLGLMRTDVHALCWVVEFPLLEWSEEDKRWSAMHHPFTSAMDEDWDSLESDPGRVRAKAYDLVMDGWEVGGGSIRIHRRERQQAMFRALGIEPEEAEEKFGHLMEAFEFGAPPHGGIATGIDRTVAILAGTPSIREVIAFPKTASATDLMFRSPSPISEAQLRELHLAIRPYRPCEEPPGFHIRDADVTDLDDLLDDIFDGKRPALYSEFAGWVQGSRRFSAFAARYRGKIRSKLKNARDEGGLQDLRAELQTAVLLLRDKRFTLEYEKYAASKQGGPDFTVTFKTHIPFNVEVRRIRSVELADADADGRVGKVIAVLCDKVRQMPPSIVNLLWLHAEPEISEADLSRAGMILRGLAERKAEDFFMRRGFESAASFLKHYHHLSGIVLRQSSEQVLWLNALARHRAPREIVTAIQRLGTL